MSTLYKANDYMGVSNNNSWTHGDHASPCMKIKKEIKKNGMHIKDIILVHVMQSFGSAVLKPVKVYSYCLSSKRV